MYLCFQDEDKRSAYPESSLIGLDENGFTLKALGGGRNGHEMVFINLRNFQGCMQNFTQALGWIKKAPKRTPPPAEEFTNSAGESMTVPARPAPKAPAPAPDLPSKPSF